MTYVIVKHKKTGSERIFTEPIFRANEHQYKFVAYTDNPNGSKKAAPVASAPVKVVKAVEFTAPAPKVFETDDVADSVLTDLQTQYKALTGKNANKKWDVPTLTEKIKAVENKG